jgi:hypothetical protein
MPRIRCTALALQTALVFVSGCMVRTYDTPSYYQQQPPRRPVYYANQPRPAYASPGALGGARYGQPAQPQVAAGAMGGARYGAPAQPQYAPQPQYPPGSMGGARYAVPAQTPYAPPYPAGAMGGARYGAPAQTQYPPGTTIYGPQGPPRYAPAPQPVYAAPAPAPPRPLVTVTYGAPVAAPPPAVAAQPGAIWVPADRPEPVWPNYALAPGQWYVVEAWGVFSCWPDRGEGVDAYYAYGPWYVGSQPQPWAQLLVDDRPMYEIARASGHYLQYRPDHRYSTMILGNGSRPKLQIASAKNGAFRSNHGGVWVRIYPAPRRPY